YTVSRRVLIFHPSGDPRLLPAFPTRRSSDLTPSGGTWTGLTPSPSSEPPWHSGTRVSSWRNSPTTHWAPTSWPSSDQTLIRRCCPTPRCGAAPSSKQSPASRSEEHTSELQSREKLVCRLL